MYENNPELQRRLSSWRRSTGMVESSPDTGAVREHMRSQNSVLRTLLLDTVAEIDTTMYALDDYLDQGIGVVLQDPPRKREVVIKTIYVAPPPARPWFQRFFGG